MFRCLPPSRTSSDELTGLWAHRRPGFIANTLVGCRARRQLAGRMPIALDRPPQLSGLAFSIRHKARAVPANNSISPSPSAYCDWNIGPIGVSLAQLVVWA